jgi:hypothetical protein
MEVEREREFLTVQIEFSCELELFGVKEVHESEKFCRLVTEVSNLELKREVGGERVKHL